MKLESVKLKYLTRVTRFNPVQELREIEVNIPHQIFIGSGSETEALYEAERKASDAIRKASKELMEVCEFDDLHKEAIPCELYHLLEDRDASTVIGVCKALLEEYGFTIVEPKNEKTTKAA